MANLIILAPTAISAIAVSRGTGGANLLSPDPKEVWADAAVGTAANIDIDLGGLSDVDTILFGHIHSPAAAAAWTITGGAAGYTDTVIKPAGPLRAIDAAGQFPALSHALWHGDIVNVRYLRLAVTQPVGQPALMAGIVMAGAAFTPEYNKEWGAGRGVVDTGSVTPLPSGGFAAVEGTRKPTYSWTLGDLTDDEIETLYALALDRGESREVLVVEDPAATPGLRNRIRYGLFQRLRPYERRNPKQYRWEFGIEDWV